ncbi:MAG: hypothetical protein J5509_02345 [Lachnospiraceae bacterium]|nr:hypothetical protein [Lachnospiraceae bacterium]
MATEPGDLQNIDAVLQVSVSANEVLYRRVREDHVMCQALEDLMQDKIVEKQEQQTAKNLKELMKNMKLTAEQAMQALGISDSDKPRYMAML